MAEKRDLTTVTIDTKTAATLDRLAKSNGVSKKDFISLSLEYFEKYGINPVEHESPAKEMQKLIKRVDQVVAFLKVQERDLVRPAMASLIESESTIKSRLIGIASSTEVRQQADHTSQTIDRAFRSMAEQERQQNAEIRKALQVLATHMDEKNKSGLLSKLFG